MYKNFSSQPAAYFYSGNIPNNITGSLTADDLKSDVNVSQNGDFYKSKIFVECPNNDCGKMNASGKLNGAGDYINKAFDIFTNYQQNQQTQSTIELQQQQNEAERLRLKQEQERTQQEENKSSIIKSYGLPIAIGGGVIIVGIATYFIFKKKAK